MSDSTAAKQVAKHDGWQILHETEATAVTAKQADGGSVSTVTPAMYVAGKRAGLGLIEFSDSTVDGLKKKIQGWEEAQPASLPTSPSEDQIKNSAKATLHQAVTAGARPAIDVDLTPAAEKATAKATNFSVDPVINENKLSEADQAGVAAAGPDSKLDGVGG